MAFGDVFRRTLNCLTIKAIKQPEQTVNKPPESRRRNRGTTDGNWKWTAEWDAGSLNNPRANIGYLPARGTRVYLPQEIDSSPPQKIDGTTGTAGHWIGQLDTRTLGHWTIGSPQVFAENAECTPFEVGSIYIHTC